MAWVSWSLAGTAVVAAGWLGQPEVGPVPEPVPMPRPRFDVNAPPPVVVVPSTRPAVGAVATLDRGRARQLLEGLSSVEPTAREAAVESVMDLSLADLEVLRAVVEEVGPLVPQAVGLLRDGVTHVYLRNRAYDAQPDVAFLGITLAPISLPGVRGVGGGGQPPAGDFDEGPVGIAVTSRMPGLAGFRYLQDGDIIVSVGVGTVAGAGMGFRSTEDFAGQIRGRRPGDRVTLGVLRSGRLVRVEAELSPRPVRMEEFNSLEVLRSERLTAARDYWEGVWLPVVDPGATGVARP